LFRATSFIDLARGTLAYFLADEDERKLFVSAFELISRKVLSLDHQKFAYYGKALLGVIRPQHHNKIKHLADYR
jgi:hypothetical protein